MYTFSWIRRAVLPTWVLACLLALAAPAPAATAGSLAAAVPARGLTAVMDASWRSWGNKFMSFLYTTFNRRDRIIQLAAVGVVLGLFIMLRRGKSGV